MPSFESAVTLPTETEALFEFLIRPQNVVQLAPPGTTLEFLEAPEIIEIGCRLEFEISGLGPTQRFLHEIVECTRPTRITERQVRGPFEAFEHATDLQLADGGVQLVDRIEFEPPGGLAGFLLTEERLQRLLTDGYAHRHAELRRLFGG